MIETQQRQALLLNLFENTSDLIQIIDPQGQILLVNRAWCETLDYSEVDVIGWNVFSLIAPECQEHCKSVFAELLSRAKRQRIECTFVSRNGQRVELEGLLDVVSVDGEPQLVRGILRDVTARRRAERELQHVNASLESRIQQSTAELQASQARLSEAQALAQVGHWDLDLVSGAMHWSDEICRLCGFDPNEVVPSYQTFLQRVHCEDRAKINAAHERIHELRKPIQLHYRLVLEDGQIRHVQARVATHFHKDGTPLRVIGTSQDVTELVQSQQRQLEGEQRLRSLVELSPLGIALIGVGGLCLDSNQAFRLLIGIEGQTAADYWLPDQAMRELEQIRRMAMEGDDLSLSCQLLLQRPHQQPLSIRVVTQRVPGARACEQGGLVWVILEDISQQLATEQSLRQAANVFRYAQEGIMITDPDGRIIDVNEALSRITGYSRQELVGATPRVLKSGEHDAAFYGRMWETLTLEGRWSGEVINRAKDGSLQDVLETISVIKDNRGTVSHYVALLTDIRQIKEQQHQLERLALYDQLTGLPNRVLLANQLEKAITEADTNGEKIAVCYMDLDGFKEINDSLGHAAGDHLLKILASRMRVALREQDLLARLGACRA